MQSKLSVLMPSIKFVNKFIQTYNFSRKISQVGGPQGGGQKFHWGAAALPGPPLEPPMRSATTLIEANALPLSQTSQIAKP